MRMQNELLELHCPICQREIGVRGVKTEVYHQYVAWCRACKTEFVVDYFEAQEFDDALSRKEVSG